MNQFIRYSCVGLALLLGMGQTVRAQLGTLESSSEAEVKAKAAAWLKATGKNDPATMQSFEALWSQRDRTTLDRLAETFAMGNAGAAKLLKDARNPQVVPSLKVPAPIAGTDQPVFFRANLALAYSRILAGRQRPAHEEGLEALKPFAADQVIEPASYLFHRAVCEHALLMKAETNKSIEKLLYDAVDCPDRYKTVSLLMILDMQSWRDKDLNAVSRKMEVIERRLDLAKAGPKTQKLQKEVVLRLDELIKEAENKAKKQEKDAEGDPKPGDPKDGKDGDQECPEPGDKPGQQQGKPQSKKATKPMEFPQLPGGSANGDVDPAKARDLQERWPSLPEREREALLEQLTQGMSPAHREAIVNYFRNIAAKK